MNKLIKISLIALAASISLPSYSQSSTQDFATCLADSLNGKERKELAKWIFLSISVHPNLKEFSKVSIEIRDKTDKYIGSLITRLLTENCPSELRLASESDPLALQKGFEFVGQVAMQEIMTNTETMKALSGYARYTDQSKIAATISKSKSNE